MKAIVGFVLLFASFALSAQTNFTVTSSNGTCVYTGASSGLNSFAAISATGSCSAFQPTPPIPPGQCASTPGFVRLTHGQVTHSGLDNTLQQDLTQFATTFTNTPNPSPFPGKLGDEATVTLGTNQYVSLGFQLPIGYWAKNSDWPGAFTFSVGTTNMDTKATIAITQTCGDFKPGICTKVGAKAAGGLQWAKPGTQNVCTLQEGVTYYLSYVSADTSVTPWKTYANGTGSQCSGKTACKVPMRNGEHP